MYMYVGGLTSYDALPQILSFFFRLISELTDRNSTKIGYMLGSNCNLKTRVPNLGYSLPLQIGRPKTPFWTTSQLNGLYLRNETRYRQWSSALTTTRGLPHRPEMS